MLGGNSTIYKIMASDRLGNYQELIFSDGNQIRSLNARTGEEASKILEYIRTNGYALIAIEGQSRITTTREEDHGDE